MTTQKRNAAMVTLLETDFIKRNEPGNLLGNIISTYQSLPGLRGFWPMSSVDENGDPYDLTMQGRTLTNNSSVSFNNTDFLPYAIFDGSADYFNRADEAGLDITTDLTLGAWINQDDIVGNQDIIAKGTNVGASTDTSYRLRTASGTGQFVVTSGTTVYSVSGSATVALTWYFIAARYTPSTELKIWVNDATNTNTTSIPATINDSSTAFFIGANSVGGFFDGGVALPFLCAYAIPDNMILNLYQQSRVLFGV